jgi:hypothetical protein
MAVPAGGVFDQAPEVTERLRQGPPSTAARPASRWTLRTIREAVPDLASYSLSGIWRWLQGQGIIWRTARSQLFSPDPADLTKRDHLLACLAEAAVTSDHVVVVFLDEMGFTRWPEPGPDWMEPGRPGVRPGRGLAGGTQRAVAPGRGAGRCHWAGDLPGQLHCGTPRPGGVLPAA